MYVCVCVCEREREHFTGDLKNTEQSYIVILYIPIIFSVDKLRFFDWSFNIKLSKINRINLQKSRRTDLKSTMNQFNIIKFLRYHINF